LGARTSADGRLRGTLAYYGAHTGRWSARGAQLQNFPRATELDAPAALSVGASYVARAAGLGDGDEEPDTPEITAIRGQLRSCVRASRGSYLASADFAQIEARGLLWLACDEEGLRPYREGADPYKPAAARIYACASGDVTREQRQTGKLSVLACSYGGGAGALRRIAGKQRIDLASLRGVTPQEIVEGFRDAYPLLAGARTGAFFEAEEGDEGYEAGVEPIAERRGGLWRELRRAFVAAAAGSLGSVPAGRGAYRYDAGDVVLTLPSGRHLRYRDVRQEPDPRDPKRRRWTFAAPGRGRVGVWHGLLAENLCQATCRDLLAEALLRVDAAGYEIVLHVHDEIVCEVPRERDLEQLLTLVRVVPTWAVGWPIDVSGAVGVAWSK